MHFETKDLNLSEKEFANIDKEDPIETCEVTDGQKSDDPSKGHNTSRNSQLPQTKVMEKSNNEPDKKVTAVIIFMQINYYQERQFNDFFIGGGVYFAVLYSEFRQILC